jgi:hypothetical protein
MTMTENWHNHIEEYNLGKLDPVQTAAFEAAMLADESLATATAEHRTLWEAQELLAERQLRSQIRTAVADHERKTARTRMIFVAASILLFLGLAAAWVWLSPMRPSTPQVPPPVPQNIPASPQQAAPLDTPIASTQPPGRINAVPRKLALAAYKVREQAWGIRGGTSSDTLDMAAKAFAARRYDDVLKLLKAPTGSLPQESLLLRAHAKFCKGYYEAASKDFVAVEAGGVFTADAQWYGCLAKMAISDAPEESWRKPLERLAKQPKHPFQKAAKALLSKLTPTE